MKRLLALVAAAAMIGGAFLIRTRVIEGNDDDGGSRSGDVVRLVCDTTLRDVCERLRDAGAPVEVTVRDPGSVSDELLEVAGADEVEFDAWLTVGPWAELTNDSRRFGGASAAALFGGSLTLATAPTELVQMNGPAGDLGACAQDVTWRCIGTIQDRIPRIGLPSPDRGDGLVLLAAATSSYFGGEPYSAQSFDDPAFQAWFRRITEVSAGTPSTRQIPLQRALAAPGTFGVVGALEPQVGPNVDGRATVHPGGDVLAPVQLAAPIASGDAAADPTARSSAVLDRIGDDRLREVLSDAGWTPVDGEPPATGLPAAGVLAALRAEWP